MSVQSFRPTDVHDSRRASQAPVTGAATAQALRATRASSPSSTAYELHARRCATSVAAQLRQVDVDRDLEALEATLDLVEGMLDRMAARRRAA
jgi:hypothetical protein